MAKKKKKKVEKKYIAINAYEEAHVIGTWEEVRDVMTEWFNENNNLEEGEVELYEVGNQIPFSVDREVSVWLEK